MKSVLMRPPRLRVLDPPALREPEVAALAHDAGAQLVPAHPHLVVRPVADVGVRLRRRLHVGADAAVPEQVDRRLEDRRISSFGVISAGASSGIAERRRAPRATGSRSSPCGR